MPENERLAFVDSSPLVIESDGRNQAETTVFIRNAGAQAAIPEFCTLAIDADPKDCTLNVVAKSISVAPRMTIGVRLRWTSLSPPVSGYLALLGKSGSLMGLRSIKIGATNFPTLIWYILSFAFLIALLVMSQCMRRLRKEHVTLRNKMGSPSSWDFSRSWASNITVGGGLLSITLLSSALPEQTHYIGKAGYAVLSVALALLVGFAPFVFNIFRTPLSDLWAPDGSYVEYQGEVVHFLAACIITVGAVIAQLLAFILLVDELSFSQVDTVFVRVFQMIIVLLGIGLLKYSGQTVYWTILGQTAQEQGNLTAPAGAAFEGQPASELTPSRRRSWAPL